MSVKTILIEPNKLLREISKPVIEVGIEDQKLMDDMLDTMYAAKGIGLAAIQIGIPKRIIVMDISKVENKKEPMHFVNPTIKNKNLVKSINSLPAIAPSATNPGPEIILPIDFNIPSAISLPNFSPSF